MSEYFGQNGFAQEILIEIDQIWSKLGQILGVWSLIFGQFWSKLIILINFGRFGLYTSDF